MKKVICILVIPVLSACGAVYAPNPFSKGHIAIMADEAGMRAFSDLQTGLVNEAKTSPDVKGAHYQHRDLAEQEETKRAYAPGFLQGLFAPKIEGGNQ
jgi:hypothetical protein